MSGVAPKAGSESSAREHALIAAAREQAAELGTSMTPQEGLPAADSFPNYQLIREIHRGGQGVVYLAIQKTTKRKVAIKVMREGPFASGAERARLLRQLAEKVGELDSANSTLKTVQRRLIEAFL